MQFFTHSVDACPAVFDAGFFGSSFGQATLVTLSFLVLGSVLHIQQAMAARIQTAIEDAGDRAQKRRKMGHMRIPLDKIGFWDCNRGGLGISAHHAHEVAWDCLANKTKLERYGCF